MMQLLACPVSDLPIQKEPTWTYEAADGHCQIDVERVGEAIFVVTTVGRMDIEDALARSVLLFEALPQTGELYLLMDFTEVTTVSLEARKNFAAWLEVYAAQLPLVLFYGLSTELTATIALCEALLSSTVEMQMLPDYAAAMQQALWHQKNHPPAKKQQLPLEPRAQELLQYMTQLIWLRKFDQTIPKLAKDDPYAGLFAAINVLQDDLHTFYTDRQQQAEFLEQRVLKRTARLEAALKQVKSAHQARLAAEEKQHELYTNLVRANESIQLRLKDEGLLLEGLQALNKSLDVEQLHANMFATLRHALDFQTAFILSPTETDNLVITASTNPELMGTEWPPQRFFQRILGGKTISVFDVSKVPEWKAQSGVLRQEIVSALHIPLQVGDTKAILVGTQTERGFFTEDHIELASRFAVVAAQALRNAALTSALAAERDTLEQRVQERTHEIELMARIPNENPHPIIRIRADKTLQYSNKPGEALMACWDGPLPRDWYCIIDQAIETGETLMLERQIGDDFYHFTYVPLADAGYVNMYGRKITDRKKAEQELLQERDFAMQIMNTVGQGLIVTNAKARITYANPAFIDMVGYSVEEIINKLPNDFVIEQEVPVLIQQQVLQHEGVTSTYDMRLRRIDNKQIDVLVTSVPQYHEGKFHGTTSIITGMTERKNIEKALALARDKAVDSSRLKSEFLATMSHEIRTPMNGMLGMTELLLDTELDEEQREFAEIAYREGYNLLRIINDILDFSKIEAGKIILEQREFRPMQIIDRVKALLLPKAAEKNLSFFTFVAPNVPETLIGDEVRFRQIITNLVSNAIKFTHQGEVRVDISLQDQLTDTVLLKVAVTDSGIGLSEADQGRLFTPFTQADGSVTRKYGGTGLGLSISRRLAELMGGKMGITSEAGKGSTFWFTCCLDLVESIPIPNLYNVLRNCRAMILSEQTTQREILQIYLQAWQMECHSFENGRDALAQLYTWAEQDKPCEVVLLDQDMLNLNINAFIKRLKSDPVLSSINLIALLDVSQRKQAQELKELGVTATLVKPIDQSSLMDALASVIEIPEEAERAVAPVQVVQTHPAPRSNGHKQMLLLVEDNPSNQYVAKLQLRKLGYDLQIANNGLEALELFGQPEHAFAAILMDIQMPELDGLEATHRIRQLENGAQQRIPIIAMTANAIKGDRQKCIDAGMDDYITKPVKIEVLREALEKWVP